MKTFRKLTALLLALLCLALPGCSRQDEPEDPTPQDPRLMKCSRQLLQPFP